MQYPFWCPKALRHEYLGSAISSLSLGDNQQESPLTHLKLSNSNRRRPNSSELIARHQNSKIRSRPLTASSLAENKPSFTLRQHNEERSGAFFPPFSLCLCWTGSKLTARTRVVEKKAGQHTGLHNLIICFICRNLFLNQSG